jgi:hypothetical protein
MLPVGQEMSGRCLACCLAHCHSRCLCNQPKGGPRSCSVSGERLHGERTLGVSFVWWMSTSMSCVFGAVVRRTYGYSCILGVILGG